MNKDFQNGFALGYASGGVIEIASKSEQEKTIDITENGTTEILPDENKVLSKVKVNVDVHSGGATEEIEDLIDSSGVLEDTEGSVSDKVEQLIDKAEWENFWYEQSKSWDKHFESLFQSVSIKTLPRLSFENATTIRCMATYSQIESVDYYINCGKATNVRQAFYMCPYLKFIYGIDCSSVSYAYEMFKNSPLLEVIQEPLDLSNVTDDISGLVVGCSALREIRFVEGCLKQAKIPNFSANTLLSAKSIQSIFNGLTTLEEGVTRTLTLYKDAKILQSQVDSANAKGWTVAGGKVVSEEEYYG